MIDPRELRIGNLGYSPTWGIEMTWGPSRNNLDYQHYGWEASDGEGLLLSESCKRIEPIPITPEWLERAGFEHSVDKYMNVDLYKRGEILIYSYQESLDFQFDGPITIDIKYIHKLQNLVYECSGGEELTMKKDNHEYSRQIRRDNE